MPPLVTSHKSGVPPEVMSAPCITSWSACTRQSPTTFMIDAVESPRARDPIGYVARTTPCTSGAGKTICSVLFEKHTVTSSYRYVSTYTSYRWENIDCSLFIGFLMSVSCSSMWTADLDNQMNMGVKAPGLSEHLVKGSISAGYIII